MTLLRFGLQRGEFPCLRLDCPDYCFTFCLEAFPILPKRFSTLIKNATFNCASFVIIISRQSNSNIYIRLKPTRRY